MLFLSLLGCFMPNQALFALKTIKPQQIPKTLFKPKTPPHKAEHQTQKSPDKLFSTKVTTKPHAIARLPSLFAYFVQPHRLQAPQKPKSKSNLSQAQT